MSTDAIDIGGLKPDVSGIRTESPALAAKVDALVIVDDKTLGLAVEIGREIARFKAMVVDMHRKPKQVTDKAHKDIVAQEKDMLALVSGPDARLREKMRLFEAARRMAAKKKADEDAAAERKRQEDEKLERAVRLENMAQATGDETFRKAADQELSMPVSTPATIVAKKPATPSGLIFKDVVGVEVLDLRELAGAVYSGKVGVGAISANISWLKTKAVQDGEAYDVPGTIRTTGIGETIRR